MNKLNVAIEDTIDKAMQSINTPTTLQSKIITPKEDIDIIEESDYNINIGDTELYDDGRATRIGELVNEFKDKLTLKQWKTYFKRIDNNGKKYNFGNNEKSVIAIGNKLVFSKYTNGKPQVYDIIKLETRLLEKYGMTAKQFSDTFIDSVVKEGYDETKVRETIRNLSEETLFARNNTSSSTVTNRSERTSENDRRIDRTSENRNKRNGFLREDGKFNNNDDVKNSKQSSFSLSKNNQNETLFNERQKYNFDNVKRETYSKDYIISEINKEL